MKIALNNKIIDTNDIFSISDEIYFNEYVIYMYKPTEVYFQAQFQIEFYNVENPMIVKKEIYTKEIADEITPIHERRDAEKGHYREDFIEIANKKKEILLERMEEIKEEIMSYWDPNELIIPKIIV